MATDVSTNSTRRVDQTVVDALQQTLLELIDVSLHGKQAHWNVVGPQFLAVHGQLDAVVEAARHASDEVAERLAAIGAAPDGRLQTAADARPFESFPQGSLPSDQALDLIGSRLDELSLRLRGRISDTAEADPISQGILIAAAEQLEKHAWMIRAQRS